MSANVIAPAAATRAAGVVDGLSSGSQTEFSPDQSSYESGSNDMDPWMERPPYVPNAQAHEFMAAHQKNWIHAPQPPYTLFKYKQSTKLNSSLKYNETANAFFRPMSVLEPVDHASYENEPIEPAVFGTPATKELEEMLYPDSAEMQMFSGYCSIPKVAINVPYSADHLDVISDSREQVSQAAYHNFVSHGEVNYAFGGLCSNGSCDFSHLGLPAEVDPNQISVQLNAELPPFVDRDLLCSPFVESNPHIYMINPNRNTITTLDRYTSSVPHHISGMTGTKISHRHVFFFGGFQLQIDSVNYDKVLDRWIMRKSIALNEDAYIFDTETIRFSKVTLKKSEDEHFSIGRIGNALTSNEFEQMISTDSSIRRSPTPTQFADPNYYSPLLSTNGTGSPRKSPSIKVKGASKNITRTRSAMNTDTSSLHQSVKSSGSSSAPPPNRSISFKENKKDRKGQLSTPTSPQVLNRQPAPLAEQSPRLTPFASSYSNRLKKERSNSGSFNSRPTSPIPHSVQPIALAGKMEEEEKEEAFFSQDELRPYAISDKEAEVLRDPHGLFRDIRLAPTDSLTSIFIFGGFTAEEVDDVTVFKPNDDLLRIDLTCQGSFFASNMDLEPSIYKIDREMVRKDKSSTGIWPSARGFFASTLIEFDASVEEECEWNYVPGSGASNSNLIFDEETTSSNSIQTSMRSSHRTIRTKPPQEFFERKALLLHGGCDGKDTFSDMYIFKFDSGEWELLSTFAYDYFGKEYKPYDDQCAVDFSKEKELAEAQIREAELRACHHTALYYNKQGREYVFFVGGLTNDYIRHFDTNEYVSDKLDVSRFAKIKIMAQECNICRILVFNVKTQTWGFFRFYFDHRKLTSKTILDKISDKQQYLNCNVTQFAGSVALNGKMITLGHGLSVLVPEHKDDFAAVRAETANSAMLWGAHVQFLFPFL